MHKHGGDIYQYPDFIDFSANINFLGVPSGVASCAKSAIDGIAHYPQVGCGRLRQAISGMEQIGPEQIICGNGAAEVIFSLALAVKPKKALLFAPTFHEYEQALNSVGCEVAWEFLKPELGFQFTEGCLGQINEAIDMVFVCNPNNPTGVLAGQGFLERLLKQCRQAGALLVVDECFFDFTSPKEEGMKRFLGEYQNLFILKAFTKIFAMPGLRLGYGICSNPGLLARMREVTQPWNVSVPAQEAGIAAAKEKAFLEETRQAVGREKAFLLKQLFAYRPGEGKGAFFIQPYGHAANFIFFQSVVGLDKELEKYKIKIRNCSNFRGLREGWYRIAVRGREEIEALAAALAEVSCPHNFG